MKSVYIDSPGLYYFTLIPKEVGKDRVYVCVCVCMCVGFLFQCVRVFVCLYLVLCRRMKGTHLHMV